MVGNLADGKFSKYRRDWMGDLNLASYETDRLALGRKNDDRDILDLMARPRKMETWSA